MADTDLIACLYPFEDDSGNTSEMIERIKNHIPARYTRPKPHYDRRDRAPTEEPEQRQGDRLDYLPRLEFRFSRGPQTSHGFVFGWDQKSDVVLPWMQGISYHHFALTFDDHIRPIVKDLESLDGTEVIYDKQGHGKRRDFIWIIGGHDVPQEKKSIVINANNHLKFQIVVAHHDITSQLYIDNVNRFRQGTVSADNLFGRLDLGSRPPTERASGAHTPGTGAIVLRKKLGEGSFGVVTHVWNVSNADEYALKQPSVKAIQKRRVDVDAWEKEARIMGRISHVSYPALLQFPNLTHHQCHIVKLLGSDFTPLPQLRFEYVPGGDLENQDISVDEGVQVLCQCLSALKDLHGQNPPIVHRDIKPGNILVQYRYRGNIYVKFGDFGLSRESPDPSTICGSWKYVAPELHNEQVRRKARQKKRSYTPAVDIWSLGVAVFECAYDLPSGKPEGVSWCEQIVKKLKRGLEKKPDDLKQFLLDTMVIMKPELRGSAQYCYGEALLLTDPGQDGCQTPLASYAQSSAQPVSQHYVADQYGEEDQQTVLLQDTHRAAGPWSNPSQDDASIDSAEMRRYIRSGGPPPTSEMFPSAASQGSFHESWLRDPLHPLGGGSTVGAMGQEISDSSGWATPLAKTPLPPSFSENGAFEPAQNVSEDSHALSKETRKRSTRSSKSSSTERYTKRRVGQIVENTWTDSEAQMAAALLCTMGQGP